MDQITSTITEWFNNIVPEFTLPEGFDLPLVILAIAFGLLLCLLGYRIFMILLDIGGFLFGAGLGYYLCSQITDIWWVCAIAALVFAVIFCILAIKLYQIGIFLCIAVPVAVICCALLTVYFPYSSLAVRCVAGAVLGLAIGLLGVYLQRPFLILLTSLQGASLISGSVVYLLKTDEPLIKYITLAVLTVAGIIFQFATTHKRERG